LSCVAEQNATVLVGTGVQELDGKG